MRVLILFLFLTGCGLTSLLPTSTGPKVNANAQFGKENTQQLVANQTRSEDNSSISTEGGGEVKKAEEIKEAERDIITTEKLEETVVENANDVTIINEAENWWVWLIALVGWLLPSPSEISRSLGNFILRLAGREPKA